MKEKGEDLSRPNVFLKTRSTNKGANPHVLKVVEEMKRSIAHIPEAEQTTAIKDKAVTDIMGQDSCGRLRTYGSGTAPTIVFRASSSITSGDRIKKMVDSATQARMIEYEARREQEIEATITAKMTEYDKR